MAAKRGRALWQKLGMRVAWFGKDWGGAEKSEKGGGDKREKEKKRKEIRECYSLD